MIRSIVCFFQVALFFLANLFFSCFTSVFANEMENSKKSSFQDQTYQLFPYTKFEFSSEKVISLDSIFQSVVLSYPEIIAAQKEIEIAEYEFLQAQGNFDLKFKSYATIKQGNYINQSYDSLVEKPTTFNGVSLFAGYRRGFGDFPVYDGKYFTRPGGEVRAGARVPLWRDRQTDANRTDLKKASIGRNLGLMYFETQKLRIFQMAAQSYWDWVAASQQYQIVKELVLIAKERAGQLKDRVDLGDLPLIEQNENDRTILEREASLIEAERYLQKTSIKLSLFYRNKDGAVLLPLPTQTPDQFPPLVNISSEQLQKDIELAYRKRPELMSIHIEREKKKLDIELYTNELKPQIDLLVSASKDLAGGRPLQDSNMPPNTGTSLPVGLKAEKFNKTDVEASVVFSVPIQTRKQRGKIGAAKAKVNQILQKEIFIKDKIRAEILDALSGVQNAGSEVIVSKKEAELAKKLEEMEKERFLLGDSTLFIVNLREQKTAEARIKYVKSLARHHTSLSVYKAVIGVFIE
jgi:outer membrane protein, heavy metal efflux system